MARSAQPASYNRRLSQRRRSGVYSIPAPVGGWNARDALPAMPPKDAVELINYWPDTTTVKLRNGYSITSISVSAQVETLIAYAGGENDILMAGTSDGFVYNVTAEEDLLAAETGDLILTENERAIILDNANTFELLSGMSNGRWQWVNITTSGGSYVSMVNGEDLYHVFDGTSFHADGDGPPYDITGVSTRDLIGINEFKHRLWFIEVGTLKAWYLPVNSIGGALASLDFSSLCPQGGYLMAMGTWTLDAGYGVDDYAVWITNKGDTLVWRMTDPTDPNSIFLVGVWSLGAPIGRRCFVKWKGDLLLILTDGVVPLSGALQSSRLNPRVAITDKIQTAIASAIKLHGSNFGWQLQPFPAEDMLLVNIPVNEGSAQEQYAMNSLTGAWTRFTGWNANCWVLFQDEIYFGGAALVAKAWDTNADVQEAIPGSILQAFSYFGSPGEQKRFTMMRPTLYVNGSPEIQANININFDQSAPVPNLNTLGVQGGVWDEAIWDTSQWAPDLSILTTWQGCNGVGFCGAPRLASLTNGFRIELVSTDVVVEKGAVL